MGAIYIDVDSKLCTQQHCMHSNFNVAALALTKTNSKRRNVFFKFRLYHFFIKLVDRFV